MRVSAFSRSIFDNQTYTYDSNGNLTSDGDMNFAYDFLNRLVKVTRAADSSVVAEYAYDGLGRRVLKVDHTQTPTPPYARPRFLYDGQDVIAEYDSAGTLQARYIVGRHIDEPLVMDRRDTADLDGDGNTSELQTFYFHTNHLGTIAALTWWDSGAGQEKLVERYTYDAYGRVSVSQQFPSIINRQSSIFNPYAFTSRRLDPETGLYYFRARYYHTQLGRFISRDPLGYVDGMNLYAGYFVPNKLDPYGKWGWVDGGLVIGPDSDPWYVINDDVAGAFSDGASATIDGFIPIIDPLADAGYYDSSDHELQRSQAAGSIARDALMTYGGVRGLNAILSRGMGAAAWNSLNPLQQWMARQGFLRGLLMDHPGWASAWAAANWVSRLDTACNVATVLGTPFTFDID